MTSDKNHILDYFYKREYQNGILEFEELLREALIRKLGKSKSQADLYISRNINRNWSDLLKQQDIDQKRGIAPYFQIEDQQSKKISYRNGNYLLKSRPSILKAIDSLDDREYEALACLCCKILGANNIYLTPPGNEGGIDFIATIGFSRNSHYFFGINGPLRIIGQSKKYSSKVQVNAIKEFITTIDQIKNRNPTVEKHIPSWFRLSKGPIIGWIISHNGFQSGAESTSKDYGIIQSDSKDISEIIALSRKHYPLDSPNIRSEKLRKDVKSILENNQYGTI